MPETVRGDKAIKTASDVWVDVKLAANDAKRKGVKTH